MSARPVRAPRPGASRARGRGAWLGLVMVALLAIAPPIGAAAEVAGEDLSAYAGRWRRIDDGETEAARLLAIDEAIRGLSWIMRKMASGVLKNSTAPPAQLEFVWEEDRLYQRVEGPDGLVTRPVLLGAEPRTGQDRRGEPFTWAWTQTPAGLRVRWEQHQAYGDNVYHVEASRDRSRLIVRHTINVTALSDVEPIVYVSRFERDETSMRAAAPATAPPGD